MREISNEELLASVLENFEDEFDCNVYRDDVSNNELENFSKDYTDYDIDSDDIDVSMEYDTPGGASSEDIDTDEAIAAARDLSYNLFEDDELIDSISDDDFAE